MGKANEMLARLEDLHKVLQVVGLSLNLAKRQLWGPGLQSITQAFPQYPTGLAADHVGRSVPVLSFGGTSGITALGVPIDASGLASSGMFLSCVPAAQSIAERTFSAADFSVDHGVIKAQPF